MWQWDADGKPQQVDEIIFDVLSFGIGEEKKLENFLVKFFEGRPFEARTPKQLALALARKTRLLSKQVEEAYNEEDKDSDLVKLKSTFERTLIQNISVHQFANMIAETLAYSLFLAFLEHIHRGNGAKITLQTAIEYLPTNVPVLKDLYELINKVSSTIPVIYRASLALLEQLEASDIGRIYQKLVEHKPGEDPVIQFYEPFLKEYDPKEREARGVYYTPKPVVDYIVRSVDWILRNKFGKEKGLADESVQLLDPATGTGTFLMSAIQEIHQNIKDENSPLGDEIVKREFNRIVLNHILKHFYGFELLIAPYAIAHLKLTLEIERLGFDFKLTENDQEPDNDRFKVYLANTLDNPDQPPQDFFGFNSIPQESESARKVKKEAPILAITGNPPYSSISTNMGKWIKDLVNEYLYIDGKRIEEKSKRNNLQNDYVKFIRFAQWKLSTMDGGVIGFITDNSYLDGRTFRGMRKNLLDYFSEIYILNLHGDTKRKELAPDGKPDKNVFDITQGVAIVFFIKQNKSLSEKRIRYLDLYASSKFEKFEWLNSHSFENIDREFKPNSPNFYFVPMDSSKEDEWNSLTSIKDIFPIYGTGIKTNRDNFVIDLDKSALMNRMNDFFDINISDSEIIGKYGLKENYVWKIPKARTKFRNNPVSENNIININYRPFDYRKLYFDDAVVFNPRKIITNQFFDNNLGLMTTGQLSTGSFHHAFVTNLPADMCSLSLQTREPLVCMPLYIYDDKPTHQMVLLMEENGKGSKANLSHSFIDSFSKTLNLKYLSSGQGDCDKTFGPEDIFYYIYSILHSREYRKRYSEQLKIDFPHIPITEFKTLFKSLVTYGRELVDSHLLGENPFNNLKTIFDDNSKWGITPKTINPTENNSDWKVDEVRYEEKEKRVYINTHQFFEGVEKEVWEFIVGGYQVCDKWLRVRKQAGRSLSTEDLKHYIKICVSLRETNRIMKEIDQAIPSWPLK